MYYPLIKFYLQEVFDLVVTNKILELTSTSTQYDISTLAPVIQWISRQRDSGITLNFSFENNKLRLIKHNGKKYNSQKSQKLALKFCLTFDNPEIDVLVYYHQRYA